LQELVLHEYMLRFKTYIVSRHIKDTILTLLVAHLAQDLIMDPIQNPFSPGAGSPPPALVGREASLKQGDILYARVKQHRAEKSLLLTGLRGVGKALQELVRKQGVKFEKLALEEIFRLTESYPYFVQEWGYQCWNHADHSPITLKHVKDSTPDAISRLDQNFFRVRFDRLTSSERNFLRAMAELEAISKLTSDIAAKLEFKIHQVGPVRAKLIRKGMIYSPAYGEVAFTVPLFGAFMKRVMPFFKRDEK